MKHEPSVRQDETPSGKLREVIRPTWTPSDDEQKALAERAVASFRAVDALEGRAWEDLIAANDAGVPITWLVDRINRSRATVYRKMKEISEEQAAKRA